MTILLTIALLAGGGWLVGSAGWIHAKAIVAQTLIEQAWARNVAAGHAVERPWSWADTTPVARLEFVRQRASMVVLAGDSGRVLAFGPGHRTGTALPGASGNSVVAAHRDTHFKVLQRVGIGDPIRVEDVAGRVTVYRVDRLDIVDEHDTAVLTQAGADRLTLVTCWPFDALTPRGPDRYVVVASRLSPPMAAATNIARSD
ncbi:MAG: class GN sortase [Lautropia sp.]